MEQKNELHIIEKNYAVDEARINEMYLWPIIRQPIYFEIFRKKFNFSTKLRTRNKTQLIKNFCYGIKHLFKLKKYEYLFFNNADKRTHQIKGKHFDVFFDAWADKVGQEKSLFIEWAIDSHYSKNKVYSKNIISDLIFKCCCFIYTFFVKVKPQEIKAIEQILTDYDLTINIDKITKKRIGEIAFYRMLFKYIKPKTIFLISSFTKETIVVAAHLEQINVYEAQHGYIGKNHQFYNSYRDFGSLYYPDYLIGFGESEKKNLPEDFIFNSDQILSIGSLYLEDIVKNYTDLKLESITKQYDKVFCVTLQGVKEIELLSWIENQAQNNPDWLFILKPRNKKINYDKYVEVKNCMLLPEHNVYQVLKYSHYNITIYSTTAVEATSFDVKTIFFNIGELSKKYFDIDDLYCAVINPGENITADHLSLDKLNKNPYFAMGYNENVNNTELIF